MWGVGAAAAGVPSSVPVTRKDSRQRFGGVEGKSGLGTWLSNDPKDFGIPGRVWDSSQTTTGLT